MINNNTNNNLQKLKLFITQITNWIEDFYLGGLDNYCKNSEIMINNEEITLHDLANKLMAFVDNNSSKTCDYCKGEQHFNSSEAPIC